MCLRWTLLSQLPGGHRLDWTPRTHLPGARVVLTLRAWLDLLSAHTEVYSLSAAAPGGLAVPSSER